MQNLTYPNTPQASALAVTTGFFDGVHRGHRAVLSKLREVAKLYNVPSCVVTFWPHPRVVLGKDEGLLLLNEPDEKQMLLQQLGIDYLVTIPFTTDFAKLTPNDFFTEYLHNNLITKYLIVGYDHRVGHGASGAWEQMQELSKLLNISPYRVDASIESGREISSTAIRKALQSGQIAQANAMLGYSYMLSGAVIRGKRLGRKIGYPTANISTENKYKLIPQNGIYAVWVTLDNQQYQGMMSIGTNPTIGSSNPKSIEVNILDFDQEIYGKKITVELVDRIRDEKKFNSLEALKAAIDADKVAITKRLQNIS
ncbi:MAG: bifunctional riboflavin kinase/FAD synthetase [Prevotellaceae bacterium]|jgi:riboflavin kinase/FMN adenylyltransferase|nr:bifunctional riboflavin kinase/FAD synthetase [Prevotellaceae bacterium]